MRSLLESQQHGVLATLSARHAGWPFASVTPYALTEDGQPILLLSQLAEHTRNVLADPRASLFVQAPGEDPQAVARVFGLYVLRTETARFVGGFGDMGWIPSR